LVPGSESYSTGTSTTSGRWQSIGIPVNSNFAAVGGGGDLSAVTWAEVGFGGFNQVMGIGNIDFVPNPRSKGAVIVRFDNGFDSAYLTAFPLCRRLVLRHSSCKIRRQPRSEAAPRSAKRNTKIVVL
jgi:hypothetical protein